MAKPQNKPPKKKKESPPKATNTNLEKPGVGEIKDLNFKVAAEFHTEFKTYAVQHGLKMVDLLKEAFEHYRDTNP